jgi:hypothetical protein
MNHIVTMGQEPQRSLAFYCDLLGFKQIPSMVENLRITWLQLLSGVMLHLIESEEAPARPDNVHHANAISLSVTPMAIVWNCARHRYFSDEAPMVYMLTVERQALVPSLSLAARDCAANACFSIGLSSLWEQFFTMCGFVESPRLPGD